MYKIRSVLVIIFCLCLICFGAQAQQNQQGDKIWLSGTGSDHTVDWDFFCTAGQNSGHWSRIAVPSNWELQGFGSYNYGLDKDSLRLNEKGNYRYHFSVPADWKKKVVRIVFDGVMTDATVKINGKLAGPTHQGAFYSFKYDISSLLRYGKDNELEVIVAKNSANISVNKAERKGDFWIFGGIFRPVYLEMLPDVFMDRASVNAKADGVFKALIHVKGEPTNKLHDKLNITAQLYGPDGQPVGAPLKANPSKENNSPRAAMDNNEIVYSLEGNYVDVRKWTPETPSCYQVVFTLDDAGQKQQLMKKIGFRTVEVRPGDGIYVNGVKIKFKGVNHHSFWPTTGRTTNKTQSITDVQMLKDMNMNAVRMSHYPPDDHFLDACDSLGLFVLDELTGWHQHYDTQVGTKLVGEMMVKDEDHPSIVMWDNGNEGGFNFELDSLFDTYDLQKRPLIHPWAIFGGMDTQHYINYDYGTGTHLHGHQIVFPTEFLHGLYDGGLGAGLGDYWREMWINPLSAGGFLWVFADEAVVRTDKNGILDADGDHGPDGIVGPYHEKEGSYNAIKEIWSPVYIEPREITASFDGSFRLQNRYFYTNLNKLRYQWEWMDGGSPGKTGLADQSTTVSAAVVRDSGTVAHSAAPDIAPGEWGRLNITLPADFTQYDFLQVRISDESGHVLLEKTYPVRSPRQKAIAVIRDLKAHYKGVVDSRANAGFKIDSTADNVLVQSGASIAGGFSYRFSKRTGQLQKAIYDGKTSGLKNGPVLCDGEAIMTGLKVEDLKDSVVLTASFDKKSDLSKLRWVIYTDGLLKMQIGYFPHQYDFDFMGVSFDFPEQQVKGIERMGAGPYRVWKNRMEGAQLGVWHNIYNNTVTGQNIPKIVYPEFKGYFSHLYWMRLQTTELPLTVVCGDEDVFLRLFTPQTPDKPANTAPVFPKGDISFMHAINPIGTKSQVAENMGPSGRKNMYYDYGKNKDYAKPLTLYFYFGQ